MSDRVSLELDDGGIRETGGPSRFGTRRTLAEIAFTDRCRMESTFRYFLMPDTITHAAGARTP